MQQLHTAIPIVVFFATAIAGYARLTAKVDELTKQHTALEAKHADLEKAFQAHVQATALHRTTDFERRFDHVETALEAIDTKLDRILGGQH